jgi:alpha-L-fucosidase
VARLLTTLASLALSLASLAQPLDLQLRSLKETEPGSGQWQVLEVSTNWAPEATAAVICDMWDQHWCKGATARVAELAPHMNQLITALRARGVLIIHCPSETMKFYEGTPGRKLAQSAPPASPREPLKGWGGLDPAREPPLPIDDSDGGCDDDPPCTTGAPWRRQIATIEIKERDAVTDNTEAYNLMRQRGITNVIIMGVHQNMCVLGRPFSIRQMVRQGQNVVLVRDLTDSMYNSRRRPWVDHFTGNDLVTWHIEKYWCPTITSDQVLGGHPFRFAADTRPEREFHNFVKLPKSDTHWRQVQSYVEETPHPDYYQASETAREAFRDLKFGVRIHWGVYATLGVDASWPFLKMSNADRQAYQHLYEKFNPTGFNADDWMRFFKTNGLRVFAFTSKHHDGFSMFDTKTRVQRRVNWLAPGGPKIEECDLAYDIMESPFKRDIVQELTDAARRYGIKIDLYFSHPDWYDADFRPFADHPLHDRVSRTEHPEQWRHFVERHRQQLTELLTNYGRLDLVCLDQYFDETAWPDLRETMKTIRKLQPDVMFRCRGIGNYGDYYTPEGFVPGAKENTAMPWMVIYPLAGIWSYQPKAALYKDSPWIVTNLVDAVAKGGNFMVGIGPDANGRFHPKAIEAIEYAGAWLRVNGQAIYDTRPREGDDWKEGNDLRYTRSKDNRVVYAISLKWPGQELHLRRVHPHAGSIVRMLGVEQPLQWRAEGTGGVIVSLPDSLQDPAQRPCLQAYAFKFMVDSEAGSASATPGDGDWDERNLVANGRFSPGSPSALPEGWTAVCPNPALAPQFQAATATDGSPALMATGNDREQCFGYVRHKVHLEGGKTYRLRVQLRTEGLEDLNRHLVHGVFGSFNDGIFEYHKQGEKVVGDSRFPGPAEPGEAEVRLYFRFSPAGKVWWERVSLQECDPIPARPVKIACRRGPGDAPPTWSEWLDIAGQKGADLALLPEMFNGKTPKQPEPLDGPSAKVLAEKALKWRMYVAGSFYEKRGDLVLNTAPLFDRQGKLVGTYSKNQLYEPEEEDGVSPGTDLPVFQCDFGKVGIMICYDSWFPEVTRLLAYRGAELVLLPNAGYCMGLMPARAADDGVCLAVSSLDNPAGIWDSGGAQAGEKAPDPTRYCRSAISHFERDDKARMVMATLDLSQRWSPHWWGGPMRSSPGGRRLRQTLIRPLEAEISHEAQRWWTEP